MGKLYLNYMSNIGHSKGLKVSIARNTFDKDLPYLDYIKLGLAPSNSTRLKYKNGEINWEEFRQEYLKKLESKPGMNALVWLIKTLEKIDVTVLCYCTPGKKCHRYMLKEVIEKYGIEVINIDN